MRSLKLRSLLCLLFFFQALLPLAALSDGEDLMEDDLDLDSLFAEDADVQDLEEGESPSQASQEPTAESSSEKKEVDLLNDVVRAGDKWTLGGSFRFIGGYSSGYSYMPWNPSVNDNEELETMALLDMTSSVSLDFQIAPEFRVLQKYSLSFPDLEIQVSEFFGDYNAKERVFVRIGRQNLTWGESRNFPFTNLTARVPEDFGDRNDDPDLSDADSYALKIDLPVSIGGVQGLVFTRNGFFEDPNAPAADEIGYGGTVNIATPQFDLTMGTFYHDQLNLRGFYSVSTTLFHKWEIYQEALISYDMQGDDVQPDIDNNFDLIDLTYEYPQTQDDYDYSDTLSDAWDLSLNIGFYVDFFDKQLKLNGEYFYCGEETELDIKNSSYPLIWGHNFAASATYRPNNGDFSFFSRFKYNSSEHSGTIIPGVTFDALPYLTLNMAVPVVFGSLDGTYYQYNPDDMERPVSFVLYGVISGKI